MTTLQTHEALRSQGPLAQPARVPALVDHQYDLEALMSLLFPKRQGPMIPYNVADPAMSLMAEAFEQRSVAQIAFLKRAAYTRSFPERSLACVAALERNADLYYSQAVARGETTDGQRLAFSNADLRSFTLAFAPFMCDLDVELATVRFAAEAELQGFAVYLARALREALAASEVQGPRGVAGLVNGKETGGGRNGSPSISTALGSGACALDPYSTQQFKRMYQALCSGVSPTLCQLLSARLLKNGVLEDILLMARERGQGNTDPLRLPRTGIIIFADGKAPGERLF